MDSSAWEDFDPDSPRQLLGGSSFAPPERGPSVKFRTWKLAVPAAILGCVGALALLKVAGRGNGGLRGVQEVAREDISSALEVAWEAETTTTTTPPPGASPSLFCWSHMEPNTPEVALLRLQLVKRASIFACNYPAVISSSKFLLGNIDGSDIWTWVNPSAKVKMGKNGVDGSTTDSFLNTEIFLIAWDTLMGSDQIWPYDFVVKVDPDAVFFPDRLRNHVAPHVGKPVYISNCGKYGGEVLLYGSLEVFSTPALKIYQERAKDCKDLPWQGWGEDYYMQQCFNTLGVENVPDLEEVGDDRCVAANCDDYTRVAFHDFKKPQEWYDCFQQAVR